MRHLQDFALALTLTLWYFISVYFAVAALYPSLALHMSFIAALLTLLIFLALVLSERDTPFLLALLFVLPTSCVAAGIIWWMLRLFGLFVIK